MLGKAASTLKVTVEELESKGGKIFIKSDPPNR
jgi:hypothetical protein